MALSAPPDRYRFGPFELQPEQRRLLKHDATIPLRPRTLDLLVALVDRAGHLVSKDELLEQVWPKTVVEEAALHVQVSALRKVVGRDAITTVSGRGYQFTLPVTKGDFEAKRTSRSKHNLPYPLTSFIGRDQEIAQLDELVVAHRLVTLTGAGGVGKTRLAIEVASRLLGTYPDGVWLVELAALSDPRPVPQAVAQALEIKNHPTLPVIETLCDHLASQKLLLVLDNAEHLIDGCVHLIDEVLRRSADVAVLVTSRERLGITGELTYRVPSLTVPVAGEVMTPTAVSSYEGVRLFVERAQLVRPDFELTAENASAVASICARLDGMPLAIELAAPRLRAMSVNELSERFDQRFALLTDGSPAALPRHRTLRSMIDWSYDLLSDVERAVLRRLSVFAGGWTLTAAQDVCIDDQIEKSDVIGLLTSLADKNLVVTEEHDGATRYRMLATIRHYSLDRLREAHEEADWRNRHFRWVLALADESFVPLSGPDQGFWLDQMARELDNFRAALKWAIEQKLPDAFRMAPQLVRWWVRRAHVTEAREWFTRLLEVIPPVQAKRDRGRALSAIGNLTMNQGDYREAERLFRESLAVFRDLDEPLRLANVQTNLALLAVAQGHYAEAEPLLTECAILARGLDDAHLLAVNLGNLAMVVRARGDGDEAAALLEESLALARNGGDRFLVSEILSGKGHVECEDGNLEAAEASLVEGLTIAGAMSDPQAVAVALERFAELAVAIRDPKRAATMLGAAARLRDEMGLPVSLVEEHALQRVSAAALAALDDVTFGKALREGRVMDLEEAVSYTLNGRVVVGT